MPVLEDAAQATGALGTRADGTTGQVGHAGHHRHLLVLTRLRISAPSVMAARSRRPMQRWPSRCDCCGSTGRARRDTYLEVGYKQPPGRDSGSDPGRAAPAPAHLGCSTGVRRQRGTGPPGSASSWASPPVDGPGSVPAWNLWVVTHPEPIGWQRGLQPAGSRPAPTTVKPVHLQPRCGRGRARGGAAPGTDLLARAAPGAADLRGDHRRADRRGGRCGAPAPDLAPPRASRWLDNFRLMRNTNRGAADTSGDESYAHISCGDRGGTAAECARWSTRSPVPARSPSGASWAIVPFCCTAMARRSSPGGRFWNLDGSRGLALPP